MTGELDLQPGLTYRSTIKLCADDICFPASRSDGVVIVPNKPVTGSLEVQFDGSKVSYRLQTSNKLQNWTIKVNGKNQWEIV
jgi:hypothetical protein